MVDQPLLGAFLAAAGLAALHAGARYLTFLDVLPRSAWLSGASGVSIAYVFVHLLPEVAAIQGDLEDLGSGALPWLERHAWVLALVGLAAFYGLELLARRGRRQRGEGEGSSAHDWVGWVHIASYGTYNALIGYLLVEEAHRGTSTLVFFSIALGVHFIVNDHALREDHGALYHDVGRWIVAGAVLVGWGVSAIAEVDEAALAFLLAFLAGSIVLNVMKEELPEDRDSRFAPFAAGAAAYTALLLMF